MKISIVTVTLNSAKTIAHCLASVAAQADVDIEHIVVDGGSIDGTVDLVRSAPLISKYVSEPDNGIYDAMNKGLSLATGDFVGFLNADDEFSSPCAMASIRTRLQHSRADILYGDLQYVDPKNVRKVVRNWRAGSFTVGKLSWGWMPPHPTFYVRRALVDTLGPFDTQYRIAADYDFMTRYLLKRGEFCTYVPDVLVKMRTGGISNGSLRSICTKSREDLEVIRRHRLGRYGSLLAKNLRKLHQFIEYPATQRLWT